MMTRRKLTGTQAPSPFPPCQNAALPYFYLANDLLMMYALCTQIVLFMRHTCIHLNFAT